MSIISITDKGKTITYHAHHMRDVIEPVKTVRHVRRAIEREEKAPHAHFLHGGLIMRVNIDCSLILLLLSGMLALLKIGGQFPYSWIWVIAPIWIPLLALAGITIILIIAWIIGVIGVLILEKFGD